MFTVSESNIRTAEIFVSDQYRGTSSSIHRPLVGNEDEDQNDEDYHHLLEAHENVDDEEEMQEHNVIVHKQMEGLNLGLGTAIAKDSAASSSSLQPSSLSLSGTMDDEGRAKRNRMLIQHMLQLDSPVVTDKMVEFFYQEGVCEMFVSFITQVPEQHPDHSAIHDLKPGPRPEKGDPLSPDDERALEKSFRAVQLLSPEEPTNALSTFLGRKAATIMESVFEVFQPCAKGSYHHACRVIDYLLRYYTDQVYLVIGRSAKSARRWTR